ncbi:unnamed protein product [Microthlaspi erraticum]|uniref:Uncharacterized protein n=1 Tax=Microthlaspi erraticum TaxID=1685480 RepID=A0A6D2HHM9_9BRAS|nr:unnamed protein product [Microthlaspi erraticum]
MRKVKIEEQHDEIIDDVKPELRRVVSSDVVVKDRKLNRTLLCVAKPSYLLGLGPRTRRSDYLQRLPNILSDLLRHKNWSEASKLLSVLMQGTMRDGSPKMNRLKYEAQIKIVRYLKPSKNYAVEIGKVYDTWIGKIGKQHKEERLLVWFEQICHFIDHGMDDEAQSAATSMMQNRDMGMLPRSNLCIGITLFRLWCRKFQAVLQPREVADCSESESVSNKSESRPDMMMVECSVKNESAYSVEESEGSVVNDSESSSVMKGKVKLEKVKVESSLQYDNPIQRHSATSEENEDDLQAIDSLDPALIEILEDMDPWLLPLAPPKDEDCYRNIVNDSYYKEAVRYLRLALQSPRDVSLAAIHPLVQLLLIGGHTDEAMKVVENMCNKVHHIKPFRMKAAMMEKFHPESDKLAKSYEDILKIDPICATTLKKLIVMSVEVGYSRESLIEMIALHVEFSFPEPEIWKEFADCLIFFFDNLDEDRMSVCLDGAGEERNQQTYSVRYNPTPRMFTDESWTLRAQGWLHRHFLLEMLETERKREDWNMMTYKAACASHIYGQEFGYVTKAYGLLENNCNDRSLVNELRKHRRIWNMIYNPLQ